jgi:hypothetical protein
MNTILINALTVCSIHSIHDICSGLYTCSGLCKSSVHVMIGTNFLCCTAVDIAAASAAV